MLKLLTFHSRSQNNQSVALYWQVVVKVIYSFSYFEPWLKIKTVYMILNAKFYIFSMCISLLLGVKQSSRWLNHFLTEGVDLHLTL